MAQELVLVPKIKYEYLLKKLGENSSSIQSGKGTTTVSETSDVQEEETDDKKKYTDLKTDNSQESNIIRPSNSKTDEGSNRDTSKNAKLFVEAPLSKMGFIENSKSTSKPRKVSLKSRVTGSKSATTSKWINYTV